MSNTVAGIVIIVIGFVLICLGLVALSAPAFTQVSLSTSSEMEKGLAYREGLLFGQAWAYSDCPSQVSIRQRWLDQAAENAKYGYRVEGGHIKMPGNEN